MKKKYSLVLFLLLLILNSGINAATDISAIGKNLENLFKKLAASQNDIEKRVINDSIVILVQQYVYSDSVFNTRFDNVKFLGQIVSPDSLVKIITWNVPFSEGVQNYYCYILTRFQGAEGVKSYKLSGISGTETIRKDTTYSQYDWYGSLYYDIKPVTLSDGKYYMLLGIDFKDLFLTRKVIDIVKFGAENELVFGRLCFSDGIKLSYREVFEYSSSATMMLRFDPGNIVVFDHLSPFSPEYKDNFKYYGPDFSYDAYALENGQLKLKQDIDVRNID